MHDQGKRCRFSGHQLEKIALNLLPAILACGILAGCASHPAADAGAGVESAARELLEAVSGKLCRAGTVQVEAEQKVQPPLGLGVAMDRAPIQITVQRPNRLYAIQPAGAETREIVYDGHSLCVMHPGPKHYAQESLEAGSIEQFAQLVDERFGFRPPLAELLANDMPAEMLDGVTSARVMRREQVAAVACQHLRLDQPGMTVELWVGVDDQLPQRMLTTCTRLPGKPTWDLHFTRWKLDGAIDQGLFAKRPAADWVRVQMLKSR
jgi:hypothetical protein